MTSTFKLNNVINAHISAFLSLLIVLGTNFYTLKDEHIGKRSAAGLYCWDCGVTLKVGGEEAVHGDDSKFYEECPNCGNKPIEESTGGRELGFNKLIPHKKVGVRSCSSFSWAMTPEDFFQRRLRVIKDEYDRRYTKTEFNQVLEECPLRYYHIIGVEFS